MSYTDDLLTELRHVHDVLRQVRGAVVDSEPIGDFDPLRAADSRAALAMQRIDDLLALPAPAPGFVPVDQVAAAVVGYAKHAAEEVERNTSPSLARHYATRASVYTDAAILLARDVELVEIGARS